MSDSTNNSIPPRGLGFYGKIKVSVKTLDKIIIVGIAAIIIILFIGTKNRGYSISYDSMGGTPVETQKYLYGDTIEPPTTPTREGYDFNGWYKDQNCQNVWNMTTDVVMESMTLYASWKAK